MYQYFCLEITVLTSILICIRLSNIYSADTVTKPNSRRIASGTEGIILQYKDDRPLLSMRREKRYNA